MYYETSDDMMISTFPILNPNGIGSISFFVHLFLNRTVTRDIKPQLAAFEITTHGLRPLGKIISIKNNMNRTRNLITWHIEIPNKKTDSKNGIRT